MILHYYAIIITETNDRREVDGMIEYVKNGIRHGYDNFSISDYDLIKREILKKELDNDDILCNQVIIKSLSIIRE